MDRKIIVSIIAGGLANFLLNFAKQHGFDLDAMAALFGWTAATVQGYIIIIISGFFGWLIPASLWDKIRSLTNDDIKAAAVSDHVPGVTINPADIPANPPAAK